MRTFEIPNTRTRDAAIAWLDDCGHPCYDNGIDYWVGKGWRINEMFESEREAGRYSILRKIKIEIDDEELSTGFALRFL